MNVEWVHTHVTLWLHVATPWVALSVPVIWDTRVTDSCVQVCPAKTPFIPSQKKRLISRALKTVSSKSNMGLNVNISASFFVDVDECGLSTQTCDAMASCSNTMGSFECICDIGYQGDGFVCSGMYC